MSTKSKRSKALYGTVGMTPVMAMMVTSTPAHAVVLGNQASTISLCSGVSLQRSDLTSVLAPLANSVSTLEGSTNTLLKGLTTGTVGTLLGNLGITGPVSTNIGGTLAAAETGNISLQAVNANGQLITPSGDCYAQANGLTLTNQKGISIGGNGVTGLGDNTKATGNAGELNSISIGNDSATDATSLNSLALGSQSKILANASESIALGHNATVSAANSTALGSNSSVSVANSVALGQGSIASRGAQTNYTGFAVGTGQNSVGEVSVGTASGLRQITNLAPGSAGTDAVNVNQLSAVNDRVTGVNNIVTNNTNNINTLTNNLNITNNNLSTTNTNVTNLQNNIINGNIGPWRYSDGNGVPTGGTITNNITVIGGSSGPVYVHNIGNGVISASSTDAVNGSQLYTLQNSISNSNTTINNQITNLTNQYNSEDNRVTNLSNVVTNNANTVNNLGNTVSTLSNNVTNNTNSINNLNTSVSNLNTQVTQNTSDIQTNATNIANVDNRVTQVDNRVTDVDNRVTDVSNSVTNVSNRVDTLDSLAVKYDATSHTRITLGGGTGGTKITNLANGDVSATSTDAVNGGQLFTVNQTVNNAVTSLNNTVNQINTQIANNVTAINTVNNSVTAIDARVTNNTNAITDIGNTVSQNTADIATNATNITNVDNRVTNLAAVAVQYDGADHTRITFGGTGGTLLTNVKAGNVSANSSDAVNGAQLYTVQQSVTDATGNLGTQITNVDNRVTNVDNRVTAIDARTTNTETNVSNLTTSVNNIDNRVTNNTNAISSINTQVTNNTNDISTLNTNVSNIDNRVTNNTQSITNLNTQVTQNTTDIATNANAITNVDNRVTNVDNRVTSVNNTVNTLNSNFNTFSSQVADGGIGPVQYSNGGVVPNGGTPTQDLTLVGGTNGAVHLHNVANGVVAQGSTDAVNGGQIFDLENSVGSLSDLAVTYDDATKSSITLGGAGTSTAVALHNVAAGRLTSTSTDAVNGAQLYATNQSISDVQNNVGNIDNSITNINNSVTNIGNRVSQNTTDISNIDARVTNNTNTINTVNNQVTQNTTSITNLDGRVTTNATNIANVDNRVTNLDNRVTQNITDLGTSITNVTNQVSQNTSNISNLDARVTNNTNSINTINSQVTTINNQVTQNTSNITNLGDRATLLEDGGAGPVQYTNGGTIPNGGVPTNSLTLVGADNSQPVALHNVADGVVAHGSTDAVNGGQLFDAVQTGVSDLAVVYDDGSHSKVSLGGTGAPAVLLTNVKAGAVNAGSTDAVNGAQLFATNQSVSTVASSVTNVTNLYNTLNQTVANNTTDISNVTNNLNSFETNVANGGVGPVQYSDANGVANGGTPSQDLTLIGANAGPVGLHNVAAGLLGANSTDAVNGAQLAGLGVAMASKLGSMSYDPTTNSFTGNFTYDGTKYGDVQSVITAIQDDQGSTTTNGVATTSKYFNANSVASNSVASGTDSTAVGPSSTSSGDKSVAMGSNANAQSDQSVAIGSGATAKDGMAVSIGMGNTASGNGAVAIGDPSSATGDGAVVLGKDDNANGNGAIALGDTNTSTGNGAASIGTGNTASGNGAVALGASNSASGLGAIAIGSNNNVTGDGSLALGNGIVTSATDTLSVGSDTAATAASAVALGNRAQATAVDSATVGTDSMASGLRSSAFGQGAGASGDYTTSIGSQSSATAIYGTAIGEMSSASGLASTALGTGAVASGVGSAAIGTGAIANEDGSVALGSATQTERGAVASYAAFGVTGSQSSEGEVAIARNVSYTDPSGNATPTGNRQITGVAAGSADTDAVNVAQLKGVSSSIGTSLAQSLGGGATYNSTTGQITGPSYVLGGVTFTSVGDAIEALARSTGTGGGGGTTPITVVDPNAVAYDNATTKDSVTLASGGTAVHNVANGAVSATSTDAVNGSQLNAVQTQVSTLASQVSNGAVGAVQYSNAATPTQGNGGTKTNDVTLVGANSAAPVALHNVADGTVASGSTDAVNGGQLAATNAHVATVETTANTALAMGQSSTQYDDSTHSSVTLGGAGDASAVGLHNVADGTSAHDAVNLGQLNSAAAGAVETANAYTDQQVKALSFDLSKVRKDSAAGVAGAMALAGMPQPYEAGRGMISGGVGAFLGQTAIAVGIAKAMSDEHTVIKAGATYNSRGQAGVNVGIGYMF